MKNKKVIDNHTPTCVNNYVPFFDCCLAISTARSVFPTNGDTKALTRHCHDALSVSSQRDIIAFLQSSTLSLLS